MKINGNYVKKIQNNLNMSNTDDIIKMKSFDIYVKKNQRRNI